MATTLGIDLGTSQVAAAVIDDGVPTIVRNQEGSTLTPSILSRSHVGDWYAGQPAKRLAVIHPMETVWDFVRLLARRFDSPEVRNAALAPVAVIEGPRGEIRFRMGGETVHPAALVAVLIAKLKAAAEAASGRTIDHAVVAVPAPFHTGQRRLVAQAASLAGFREVQITASTSVAALAFHGAEESRSGVFAIVDVGGGSVGVSIVVADEGYFQVLSRESESFLGGEDFDQVIVRWLMDELYRREGIDASTDPVTLSYLKEVSERAKRRLSVLAQVEIEVPLSKGVFSATLSRESFESMLAPQLEWLEAPCARALKSAGIGRSQVDVLLALGGSTRIPRVLQTIADVFGTEPSLSLHPEESAAAGAAILGAIHQGDVADKVFLDVVSHDLGIEYPRGEFAPILLRGTHLPTKKSRRFSTRESRLTLHVLESTNSVAADSLSLGRIIWEFPYRARETEITVEIEGDLNGALRVTALEPSLATVHRIPLRASTDLSTEEAESYRSEVERYLASLLADKVSHVTGTKGLSSLGTAEKVMAALNGGRKVRLRLVHDPDRVVWTAVLESPRTTPEDAAAMAALTDVDPKVLREIAANPDWSKRYEVALALVENPRAPLEVTMKLVDRLRTGDLERILAEERLSSVLLEQCRALMKMRF
jgi:molecular chaperone DnaK